MRKRYTTEQREQLLAEVRSSGETVREVAARLGVGVSAAYLWVKEAGASAEEKSAGGATAPVFARVVPEHAQRGLVVEVGSAAIRVDGEFDAKLLREVVAALSERT
jgi:transposase-like protein